MGRKAPIGHDSDASLLHSVLSFSLLMVSMAATIAMISALCIRRKKSSAPPLPTPAFSEVKPPAPAPLVSAPSVSAMASTETCTVPPISQQAMMSITLECEGKMTNDDQQQVNNSNNNNKDQVLPLPPAMKKLTEAYSCSNMTRTMSVKKIETSVSMKMSRSLSMKSQDQQKRKGQFKTDQDSVWTKTIILGEKCRPDGDDPLIYDTKGNRISTYHKKTHSNYSALLRANSFIDRSDRDHKGKDLLISRTNSFIDQRVMIPGEDLKEKGIVKRKDEQPLV